MFTRKPKQQSRQQKDAQILSPTQLSQLKQAFSDISLNPKKQREDDGWNNADTTVRQTPLIKTYKRIKSTFYDLNSRSFDTYSYFSSRLNLGKAIEQRPELHNLSITVNTVELLTVIMAFVIPRKVVYKVLLTLATLTIQNQFVQKLMLNYFVQQLAIHNNLMQPVQQQARNLIQFKYRIHKGDEGKEDGRGDDPYIKGLLEEVDQKNLEYFKFKKVQMLL